MDNRVNHDLTLKPLGFKTGVSVTDKLERSLNAREENGKTEFANIFAEIQAEDSAQQSNEVIDFNSNMKTYKQESIKLKSRTTSKASLYNSYISEIETSKDELFNLRANLGL